MRKLSKYGKAQYYLVSLNHKPPKLIIDHMCKIAKRSPKKWPAKPYLSESTKRFFLCCSAWIETNDCEEVKKQDMNHKHTKWNT